MASVAMIQRFLPSRSRGGVAHFTHGLATELVRRGHEVTVFSRDPAPGDAAYEVLVVRGGRSPAGSRWDPLVFPFALRRPAFAGFDVIHAQGDDQLIRRSGAPPVVRTMHGSALAEAVHNGWRRRSPKRLAMHLYFYACELLADLRADAVVAVSRDTARYYPRVHRVIPNGVDLDRFAAGAAERAARPSILFVGELDSRKRGRLLLDVFRARVRSVRPDAELWLVCPEPAEAEGVRWFGEVDAARLAQLYRQAWVFCLPSSYEGFGRPYIEAMAAGTPVVATANPGAREILDDGQHGLVVTDDELGEALGMLLARADVREDYGRRGAARARLYAWDRVAEQYEHVYESVRRKRSARPSPV
jgi:glycosyltransferase involved in cell wall biosynthesis